MKHILLLSLSTFPKFPNESIFNFKNTDDSVDTVTGIYQLDPVPNMLRRQGIVLDKVIMLCTSATMEPAKFNAPGYQDGKDISPVDYFTQHINALFSTETFSPEIVPISINESNPEPAIQEAVSHLNTPDKTEEFYLHVDTHGGFRSTQMVVEAIINLLVKDQIKTTFYSIKYSDSEDTLNWITQDNAIKIFDFVSGINEFLNYGRINSIYGYIESSSNRELLSPIEDIAEGIQWCNLPSFYRGLSQLNDYYASGAEPQSILLQLFKDKIKKDYDKLITSDNSEPDATEIILWCMKKGFYQQALTIIESKIISSLIGRNIIQLSQECINAKPLHKVYASQVDGLTDTDILNGCIFNFTRKTGLGKKIWKKEIGDTIQFNVLFNDPFNSDVITQKICALIQANVKNSCKTGSSCDYDKVLSHTADSDIKEYNNTNYYCSDAFTIEGLSSYSLEKKKIFCILFFLHTAMKDIRNQANHALKENPYHQQAVKNAILYYADLVEYLTAH